MDYYGPLDAADLARNRFLPRFDAGAFLTTRVAYDGSGNAEYIGLAAPGADEAEAVWLVRKMIYDGGGNLAAVLFADGDDGKAVFAHSWSGRTGHAYA